MTITETKVFPINNPKGSTKAFASIVLDGVFCVKGIKIIDTGKGPFVGMPSEQSKKDQKYYDICYPITKEFRQEINEAVLAQYNGTAEPEFEAPQDNQGFGDEGPY
jgi:stage V sporulation protein G